MKEKDYEILGVVGLGYVGLPLAMEFVRAGYRTIGFDKDCRKVKMLSSGETYIKHIGEKRVKKMVNTGLFEATSDFSRVRKVDAISICVPTPLTRHKMPDLSFVLDSTRSISTNLKKGALVILESTTYPGTTREEIFPILKNGGRKIDEDFYLAFSPEREDPGNKKYNTRNIPKVVGGVTKESTRRAVELYATIFDKVVEVSSSEVAEATKLLENTYRSVNIALVNELKIIFDKMGINIWEVIEAAKTKPFGYSPFYPGPGLGGHCIPIDPFYLSWKAKEFGINTRFIELAGEINTSIPEYVVDKTISALNEQKKSLSGSNVLVIGVTYKKDIDDTRESPGIRIMEMLIKRGANVSYYDPYIPKISGFRQTDLVTESVVLTEEFLSEQDAIIITTAHSNIDYKMILENSALILDTRNVYSEIKSDKIVKA
ncbi:MAG: nucleotide sugar dehydrogenase [candidate division WOR-3 bacterium]|nr:nucleotide sugar dehydrogenase [candidate division WOR-3 bacterium]